jgi:hypothetical protein
LFAAEGNSMGATSEGFTVTLISAAMSGSFPEQPRLSSITTVLEAANSPEQVSFPSSGPR